MEISIKELKNLFIENSIQNLLISSDENVELNSNYTFSCSDSKHLLTDNNTIRRLNPAYLCLHHRNYKLILVDQTDWIYCEFIRCSINADQSQAECTLNPSHLLSLISIDSFNICVENVNPSQAGGGQKQLYCLQTDLENCVLNPNMGRDFLLDFKNAAAEQGKISYMKTNELLKAFRNETNSTMSNSEEYLFRVIHKSSIHSMANSQFKTKLRADIRIEILNSNNGKICPILLALMSKFLFYYSCLCVDKFYVLRASNNNNNNNKKLDLSNSSLTLLIMNDSMKIFEVNSSLKLIKQNLFDRFKTSLDIIRPIDFDSEAIDENESDSKSNSKYFLNFVSGILIEKKLIQQNVNNNNLSFEQSKLNDLLMNQFDLMIPNREFKLMVKLKNTSTLITVYYETKFSLYPLSILPGKLLITLFHV
jgi:hypothetical protein